MEEHLLDFEVTVPLFFGSVSHEEDQHSPFVILLWCGSPKHFSTQAAEASTHCDILLNHSAITVIQGESSRHR